MKRIAMMIGLCAAALPAQTFTTLHSFDGTDGAGLAASLTQGTDGNLYGTAGGGGGNALGCPPDCGTVFEITPAGALTTLYRFCAQPNCADGSTPQAGLVQATNGDFYGTTHYGGTAQCPSDTGCGTVFRIASGGVLTTLYSFCSQAGCADGELPSAGPMEVVPFSRSPLAAR
jgi:uncharacterized repeat protein (TIGR03803 family)